MNSVDTRTAPCGTPAPPHGTGTHARAHPRIPANGVGSGAALRAKYTPRGRRSASSDTTGHTRAEEKKKNTAAKATRLLSPWRSPGTRDDTRCLYIREVFFSGLLPRVRAKAAMGDCESPARLEKLSKAPEEGRRRAVCKGAASKFSFRLISSCRLS